MEPYLSKLLCANLLIFTCGFKQYGIYLMDPYLRKLLYADPYLWIQRRWAIIDGSLLEEISM